MMLSWKSLLPLLFVIALVVFEEIVSNPSCRIVPESDRDREGAEVDSEDLKVMMVANLLLMGSEAGYMNMYFRDSYMAKFFRKSFERLKPDMLIVLGDFSAKGSDLTTNSWTSALQQFQRMLGPFLGLPLHIVLGDRDIGECSELNAKSVSRLARDLPGMDPAGCSSFEVNNISFVSLNAVAMLCGNNDLRFSVEGVIEKESVELRKRSGSRHIKHKPTESFVNFQWRENEMPSGSGPVLLLHFPLHRTTNDNCEGNYVIRRALSPVKDESSKRLHTRFALPGPYDLLHTLPLNATEYIFQALKPRVIFSAHAHEYIDYIHKDGTREVTVPAMTWDAKDDPGFIFTSFGKNGSVTISQCSLARESHVLMVYASVIVLLISTTFFLQTNHS